MDKISYAMAAQAEAKATEAIELIKKLNVSLTSATQTIQSLTTELNNLKTQLDNTTLFDPNILKDYAKKVQTINTDTVFVDANTGSHFKMYITNNAIAIEDVAI